MFTYFGLSPANLPFPANKTARKTVGLREKERANSELLFVPWCIFQGADDQQTFPSYPRAMLLLSKPSMEKDPAPRTRTATAKPIASRWYSNPSPFC